MSDNSTPRSCRDCPSFLAGIQVTDMYGRTAGSPMCGRFGYVLGKPDMTNKQHEQLAEKFADGCAGYGQPRPPEPSRDHTVMLPMPSARVPGDPAKQNITTCAQCKKLVPERVVADATGWSAAICSAKGRLIMTNRLSQEWKGCEYREFGTTMNVLPIGGADGMNFLPVYTEVSTTASVPLVNTSIEPADWPTDRPVSPEDAAGGVKAWRAIHDPHGSGNVAYLPVYDEFHINPDGTQFLTDDERLMVPKTGDDEHPELYIDHFGGLYTLAVAWTETDETPMFQGQPGTGKTELLRHAAWLMRLPFRRLSIVADSQSEDVIGTKEFSPEEGTYFVPGDLPTAWVRPGILCIDEPNVAKDPAVWHEIRPLTDNSKQMVVKAWDNRRLDRNADCYLAMCINPAWDVRNVGTMEVGDADTNRLYHISVPLPPRDLEEEIIKARVHLDGWEITPDQLRMLMGIAEDLRDLTEDVGLPFTWAIRQQIKVARALRWFTVPVAYRRAIGDALEPSALETLMDVVKSHYTED